jgi:thiamine transport system permease protein
MYSFTAIIIAHVFYNSPIFVKYLSEGLRRIPQSLKESAYVEGAGKVKTFFYIELPLIVPSISRAFFLVFTYSFTSFAIVLNLGGIKYSTLEVAIATTLKGTLNFSKALSYALIQFIVLTLINIFMSKFEPQSFEYNEPEYSANKKTGKLSLVISIFYLVFEYSLVIIGIASCFFNFITLKFDLSGFINLFSKELNNRFPVIQSIFNSISVSAITGILATIAAYLLLKKYNKIINIAIMSTFGISSAFLGMALLYLNILYNIPFFILIILGFFLISVPLAYSFLYQPILSFDKKIIEAAKVDGANKLVIFSKIELPLLFSSFLSSFLQIFAIIYGEFTISYTMQIRDYFPLSSIVNYSLSSSRFYREATALSGLNVIIIFITFYLSSLIRKKE